MTIGDGELFKKVVVYLLEPATKANPGLEFVAFSRVKNPYCLAVGNEPQNLTTKSIQKIGKSKVYKLHQEFQNELETMDQQTR